MSSRYCGNDVDQIRPEGTLTDRPSVTPWAIGSKVDWRGWIAVAWVIGWGWAYGTMAFQAKAPQVLAWLRTIWR
jgi:hypothetical protein